MMAILKGEQTEWKSDKRIPQKLLNLHRMGLVFGNEIQFIVKEGLRKGLMSSQAWAGSSK